MSENNSKERKKLSLSGGKLTLKSNLNPNKIPPSVTTGSRSGRNTVQVEVKRSKKYLKILPRKLATFIVIFHLFFSSFFTCSLLFYNVIFRRG